MNLLHEYIRELLTEANEYGWKSASRKTMKLDKDGMEQSDKDNQEKYLKSMGLMENTYDRGFIMKITLKQLRRIIREATYDQLPYKAGQPWQDPDLPIGKGASLHDDLDVELTDEEMDDAGYYEEDEYPFTVSYTHSKTGEKMENVINNDGEAEDFFHMFFNTHGRAHPYSVN